MRRNTMLIDQERTAAAHDADRLGAGVDGVRWERGSIERMHSRRRQWTILIAVALATVLVAGVLALVLTRSPDKKTASAPHTTASPAASTAAPVSSSTPAPASTTPIPAMLTTAPRGVTWRLFRTLALPYSKTDGPTKLSGPVYAGYSHTPTGALLAASQISVRYLVTPGQGWRQVVAEQVEPGPGRDSYVKFRATVTDDNPADSPLDQIVGFQYLSYDGNTAVVNLAGRSSEGDLQSAPISVTWTQAGWKMQLPAVIPQPGPLTSLAGYVLWSGVS